MAWDEESIMDFLNGNNNQFNHFLNKKGACSYSLQGINFLIYWCVGDTCELYFQYPLKTPKSRYSPVIEFFNAARPIINKKLKARAHEDLEVSGNQK